MPWRVLITSGAMLQVGMDCLERLRAYGMEVVLASKMGPLPADELAALLPGFDAVLASVDQFTRPVLESAAAANLKLISRWGVGYDSIDIPAATERGVVVAYTPGLLNEAVADYAFSMLCALARRVHEGHRLMTTGVWKPSWGHDIYGKTLGIIGCGRIGKAIAKRASGFNMRVLGVDPSPCEEGRSLGIEFVDFQRVLAESDFISLNTVLKSETRGLFGEKQFAAMKTSAYLINTSRGPVIDDRALAQALHEGRIAGAALDVFDVEPLPADHPLRGAPNLLLSPHQSSMAQDTGETVSRAATDAIIDLAQGRRPRWVVNEAVYNAKNLRAPLTA